MVKLQWSSAEELYAVSTSLNPPDAKVPIFSRSTGNCHSSGKVLSGLNTKLVAVSQQSWIRLHEVATIRGDELNAFFSNCAVTHTDPPRGFYYQKCYQEYTNKVNIERFIRKQPHISRAAVVQDATASQTTLPAQKKWRRSPIPPTNFALCVICQQNTSKQKRSQSTHHCYA